MSAFRCDHVPLLHEAQRRPPARPDTIGTIFETTQARENDCPDTDRDRYPDPQGDSHVLIMSGVISERNFRPTWTP
jgi:hypothetical protein